MKDIRENTLELELERLEELKFEIDDDACFNELDVNSVQEAWDRALASFEAYKEDRTQMAYETAVATLEAFEKAVEQA